MVLRAVWFLRSNQIPYIKGAFQRLIPSFSRRVATVKTTASACCGKPRHDIFNPLAAKIGAWEYSPWRHRPNMNEDSPSYSFPIFRFLCPSKQTSQALNSKNSIPLAVQGFSLWSGQTSGLASSSLLPYTGKEPELCWSGSPKARRRGSLGFCGFPSHT